MGLRIAGRRALVTGSSSRIGYAIAEALAREGANVILNGRSKKNLDAAVRRALYPITGEDVVNNITILEATIKSAARDGAVVKL
jgi:NAD(P)-dependent dehydrogenase (short-subunit alcohol dehydrogenase family)